MALLLGLGGVVVRSTTEIAGEWVPMDMWDYYFSMVDESPYFEDDYERISEEEALEAIRKPGG